MIGNPIEYRRGDLFNDYDKSLKTILVHGCNAQGAMGSGVARIFREMYPAAHDKYVNDIRSGLKLGGLSIYQQSDQLYLVSAITQDFYGRDSKRYVSYDAVNDVFLKVYGMASYYGYQQIVFPKIGAGLGGGDWEILEKCIISANHEAMVNPDNCKSICFVL